MKNNGLVQFITHFTDKYSYLDSVKLALEGGCRWLQLRMKEATEEETLRVALQAQSLCQKYHATFIIDDRVTLTKEIHADGVHLGKKDMPIHEARKFLGKDFIIGGTANTFADIEHLYKEGADYIGCGPFRFTTTKKNLSPVLGLDGYRRNIQEMKAKGINIPVIAIGGITVEDIPAILSTGVSGIALSGTILRAENPVEEMRRVLATVRKAKALKE